MKTRTFGLMVFLMAVVPMGGCGMDTPQRVAALRSAIAIVNDQSAALDAKILQVEALLKANESLLADPNATGAALAELREENAALQAKLAAAKPVKRLFGQKLAAYRSAIDHAVAVGGMDPNKEAELYGKGISVIGSALPAPWNVYATLLGGLVTAFGGAIGGAIARGRKAKADQAKDQASIQGIVDSVDALLADKILVTDPAAAKKELAYSQVKSGTGAAEAVQRAKATKSATV